MTTRQRLGESGDITKGLRKLNAGIDFLHFDVICIGDAQKFFLRQFRVALAKSNEGIDGTSAGHNHSECIDGKFDIIDCVERLEMFFVDKHVV